MFWVIPRELKAGRPHAVPIVAGFPLVGVALALTAAGRWRAWRRTRGSALHLDTLPGRIGATLRGRIETSVPLPPGARLTLCLHCGRRRQLGRRRGLTVDLLERRDVEVPASALGRAPRGLTVAVEVPIPEGAPPTTPGSPLEGIVWRLDLDAEGKTLVRFEVPVFAPPAG
jgi:hypothetical protein